jgi:hypothetical protein
MEKVYTLVQMNGTVLIGFLTKEDDTNFYMRKLQYLIPSETEEGSIRYVARQYLPFFADDIRPINKTSVESYGEAIKHMADQFIKANSGIIMPHNTGLVGTTQGSMQGLLVE